MPDSRQRSRSPAIAAAVIAMMGVRYWSSSNERIIRVAS